MLAQESPRGEPVPWHRPARYSSRLAAVPSRRKRATGRSCVSHALAHKRLKLHVPFSALHFQPLENRVLPTPKAEELLLHVLDGLRHFAEAPKLSAEWTSTLNGAAPAKQESLVAARRDGRHNSRRRRSGKVV